MRFGRHVERRSAEPNQLANDASASTAAQSGKLRGVRYSSISIMSGCVFIEAREAARPGSAPESRLLLRTTLWQRPPPLVGYGRLSVPAHSRRGRPAARARQWPHAVPALSTRAVLPILARLVLLPQLLLPPAL